jgi:uncharacterized protein YjbI with pentapeptide repeats
LGTGKHVALLEQGPSVWNAWRAKSNAVPRLEDAQLDTLDLRGADLADVQMERASLRQAILEGVDLSRSILRESDLSGANLRGATLHHANLNGANLVGADLTGAGLWHAILREADVTSQHGLWQADQRKHRSSIPQQFRGADLSKAVLDGAGLLGANLRGAKLQGAHLHGTDLTETNLSYADFAGADLTGADLTNSILVETNLEGAALTGCYVYGVAAWNNNLQDAVQADLTITRRGEPSITVDDLEVAQFIHLLLNNRNVRRVIDTVTSKAVLILGRFTPERKAILDAIRVALRQHNYLPILFDFDKPAHRDLTETVASLAGMSRFIVADLTEARSIPQELMAIVPMLPSVAVQPIVWEGDREWGMYERFERYPWVLPIYRYENLSQLLTALEAHVIAPAEAKVLRVGTG